MLHIALTVVAPAGDTRRDVVVRAGGQRLVSELASDVGAYLGLPAAEYGVVVQRTGEHLVAERRLDQVDLREGDIVLLLEPGDTVASRERRPPMRRLRDP